MLSLPCCPVLTRCGRGKNTWSITKSEQCLDEEQLRLLLLETLDKERQKWERLRRKFSSDGEPAKERGREPISEHVRVFIWRRDEGKCVQCGSQERLEYDHMIPVSKGGSNTDRNIQLLCEACNRTKSEKI